jgi:hypothetical protein
MPEKGYEMQITGTVINVTQADIDEAAIRRDAPFDPDSLVFCYSASCGCAITVAMKRIISETIWTASGRARIGERQFYIPGTQEFMNDFDARKPVKPFTFVIGEEIG